MVSLALSLAVLAGSTAASPPVRALFRLLC
jgi:hypothetical protein